MGSNPVSFAGSGGIAITQAEAEALQAANLLNIVISSGTNNTASKAGPNQPVNGPWRPPIWSKSDPTGAKARYSLSFPGNYKDSGSATGDANPSSVDSEGNPVYNLNQNEHLKTSVLVFDAILRANFNSQLRITEYPVQSGQMYANTAVLQPVRISLEIGMSDAVDEYIIGSFGTASSKSVSAFQIMCELQQYKVFCTINSIWGVYYPMLLEDVSMGDDVSTFRGAKFTATFRQVFLATVADVTDSSRPQTTQNSNTGTANGVAPDQKTIDGNKLTDSEQIAIKDSTVKTIPSGFWSSVSNIFNASMLSGGGGVF